MSIAGIKINQAFNNASLSAGSSLAEALLNDAHLINWFQADARSAVLDGANIVSLLDKKGTPSLFTRPDAAKSARLTDGLYGLYPGARFNAAELDRSTFSGAMTSLSAPFTWAGVATLNANDATGNLLATFTSASVRCILNAAVNTSTLKFQYGTASTAALNVVLGQPFTFACGFDGANIFLTVNGITSVVPAAGSPSTSPFSLASLPGASQFWDGSVADLFICNVALNAPGADSVALLGKIRAYAQTVYGLTF
jgi:hypothetical protein